MIHARSWDEIQLNNSWVTIGMFDGVHRGHRAIIEPMAQRARAAGSPSVVITFHPSPAVVLRGLSNLQLLTPPDERAEQLGSLGVDAVVTLEFTRELAQKSAEEFVREMSSRLGLARLWIGYDFALGRNREGNLPVLQALGERFGYQVEVIPPVEQDGGVISSSRIRALLGEGRIGEVTSLLGRWYSVRGKVVSGDGRGRTLGMPTANILPPPEKLLPPNGVYACWLRVRGKFHPSVVNIGLRPTFAQDQPQRRIEAHIFDFDEDIYEEMVNLDFAGFIRAEQRFESPQALVEQVQRDIRRGRDMLVEFDLESGG